VRHVHPRIHPEGIIVDEPAGDASSANLDGMLEDFERRVITETLRRYDYNVARAATALGLGSRQTLYKKLKRLTINVGDFLQDEGDPGIQLRVEKD
jgi:DNA-binding NtrC family response regulator